MTLWLLCKGAIFDPRSNLIWGRSNKRRGLTSPLVALLGWFLIALSTFLSNFFFGGVLLGALFFNFLAIFSFILPPRGIACLVSRCPGAARLLWQTAPPHTTPLTPVVTINANSGLPPNTSKQIRPSSCDFLTDEHWPNMTLSRSDTGWFQWGTALGRIAIITKHSTTPKLSWCQTFAFDLRLLSTSLFKYLISNIITSQKAWD